MENFSPFSFDKNATFASKRLFYRAIQEKDADRLIAWRSHEDIYRQSGQARPISKEEHTRWFLRYQSTPGELRFLIAENATKREIGLVGGTCEKEICVLSYYIGESDCRCKGYAREAIAAFMDYIHSAASLNVFHACIRKDNAPSIACVLKLGFTLKNLPEDTDFEVYEYRH